MRKLLVIPFVLVACLATAIAVHAFIPSPTGVINGCYKTSNPGQGALVVIDSTATCPSGTAALNWNQTGPAGPSGVSGYEQTYRNWPGPFAPGAVYDFYATCPAGKEALGGGFDASNGGTGTGASPLASWPGTNTGLSVWNVRFVPGVQLDYVTVFVTCAVVAS
jgi:hypothetical protein